MSPACFVVAFIFFNKSLSTCFCGLRFSFFVGVHVALPFFSWLSLIVQNFVNCKVHRLLGALNVFGFSWFVVGFEQIPNDILSCVTWPENLKPCTEKSRLVSNYIRLIYLDFNRTKSNESYLQSTHSILSKWPIWSSVASQSLHAMTMIIKTDVFQIKYTKLNNNTIRNHQRKFMTFANTFSIMPTSNIETI